MIVYDSLIVCVTSVASNALKRSLCCAMIVAPILWHCFTYLVTSLIPESQKRQMISLSQISFPEPGKSQRNLV